MICPKCSKEIPEGSKYCTACGFKVTDDYSDAQSFYDKAPTSSDAYSGRPEPKAPEPAESPLAPANDAPAEGGITGPLKSPAPGGAQFGYPTRLPRGAFLEVFKSKAFVVLIVGLCAYAVLFAMGAFGKMPSNLFSTLSESTGGMFSDADIAGIIGDMRIGTVIGGIVELLPLIFAIIGLFMINSARFDRPLISGGFSLCRAYAIIMMVVNIITFGLLSAAFIVLGVFTSMMDVSEIDRYLKEFDRLLPGAYRINISGIMLGMMATVLFTIAGVMIVVMVFRIIYYAKMQSSVKKLRMACSDLQVSGRIPSGFVGVYAIIMASISFLGIPFMSGDLISGLTAVFLIISKISFAVLVFTFRKTMKLCDE